MDIWGYLQCFALINYFATNILIVVSQGHMCESFQGTFLGMELLSLQESLSYSDYEQMLLYSSSALWLSWKHMSSVPV